MVQQVNQQVQVAQDPPPQVVAKEVELPTFAQSLQGAVSAFTGRMGALKTARGGVEEATETETIAETQLREAKAGKVVAVASETDSSQAAITARDELVTILAAWTP